MLISSVSYRDQINKSYEKLESLSQEDGPVKEHVRKYLKETQKDMRNIANSLFPVDGLGATVDVPMKKLRDERRAQMETAIKARLKGLNFKVGADKNSMAVVCKTDHVEAVCPEALRLGLRLILFEPIHVFRRCFLWFLSCSHAMSPS